MTDPGTQAAARATFGQEALALLKTLNAALEHDDPAEARRALRAFLETAPTEIESLPETQPHASRTAVPTPPAPPPPDGATDDPERATRRWIRGYANHLTEWQLDEAEKLIATPPPHVPPRLGRAPALLRAGTRAVVRERHTDAREMLRFLTKARDESPDRRHLLSGTIRARLFVYLARIALYIDRDSEKANDRLTKAGRLAPEDGIVHAGIGSLRRHSGDAPSAQAAYQHAIALEPDRPDGYVGMGLLAEDDGRLDDARGWYDRALTVAEGDDLGRALRRLFAPVPANLLLQWADRVSDQDPEEALQLLTLALDGLTQWEGETASRIHMKRAELLREPEDAARAADAYYLAATKGAAPDDYRAELLERSIDLDAAHQPAHWELAELLRLRQFQLDNPDDQRGSVDRGIRVWTHAYDIGPPDADLAWVYVTRALLAEQLADLRGGDRFQLYWEAVGWIERAFLFEDRAYWWLHLSRLFYQLDLTSNALAAITRAESADPDDIDIATQHAVISLAVGDYEDAERILTEARERTQSAFLDELLVWLYAETNRARDGIELIEPLISESSDEPDLISLLDLRMRCYRRAGDSAAEAADAERIVAAYQADVPGDERAYASALTLLALEHEDPAQLDEALTVLEGVRQDRFEQDATLFGQLGIVQLARGDHEEGRRLVHLGLDHCDQTSAVDEIAYGLDLLAARGPASLRQVVEELRADADRACTAVRPRSPQEEVESSAASGGPELPAGLTLTRLAREAGDWPPAVSSAQSMASGFPEAEYRALVHQLVSGLLEDADELLRAGDPEHAKSRLDIARGALSADMDMPSLEAELVARIVALHTGEGEHERAAKCLASALELFERAGSPDPLMDCWKRSAQLMPGSGEIWQLDDLARALEGENSARTLAIVRHLPELEGLDPLDEPIHDPRPVVRIGEALIPADTGPNWPLMSTYMPEMRERVRRDTGVSVPGSRFRAGRDITPGEYQIVLAGLSGERALARPQGSESNGGRDPIEYVVDGLEMFLKRHLAELVSAGDVIDMVSEEYPYEAVDVLLPTRLDKLRLARVVRALAAGRVPLRDWKSIVDASLVGGASTVDAVRGARRGMWQLLPGNEEGRTRRPIPPDLVSKIDGCFQIVDSAVTLTGTPVEAVEVERAVAAWISQEGPEIAIVTDTHELRLVVERLARRHHPDVPTLAREETLEAVTPEPPAPGELHAN
jgi:Flp pilus assembly protein TadD